MSVCVCVLRECLAGPRAAQRRQAACTRQHGKRHQRNQRDDMQVRKTASRHLFGASLEERTVPVQRLLPHLKTKSTLSPTASWSAAATSSCGRRHRPSSKALGNVRPTDANRRHLIPFASNAIGTVALRHTRKNCNAPWKRTQCNVGARRQAGKEAQSFCAVTVVQSPSKRLGTRPRRRSPNPLGPTRTTRARHRH